MSREKLGTKFYRNRVAVIDRNKQREGNTFPTDEAACQPAEGIDLQVRLRLRSYSRAEHSEDDGCNSCLGPHLS